MRGFSFGEFQVDANSRRSLFEQNRKKKEKKKHLHNENYNQEACNATV